MVDIVLEQESHSRLKFFARVVLTLSKELWNWNSQKIFLPFYFLQHQVQCSAQLCLTLCNPWTARLLCPWNFSGKNTGAGCHFFLQGIFPTQGLTPDLLCLLHCRQILYCWATGKPDPYALYFLSLSHFFSLSQSTLLFILLLFFFFNEPETINQTT